MFVLRTRNLLNPKTVGLVRGAFVASALLLVAACSGSGNSLFSSRAERDGTISNDSKFSAAAFGVAASPRLTSSRNVPKGGGRYMVGSAYQVAGRWYRPAENTSYDETGTASWYGPNFHGRMTANGETFDQFHLSGAHPTLPLPSYVRVMNLANGNSTVVRLNDRGPFAHNRVIDVSRRTAEVLGFIQSGTARVRVTYLGRAPVEGDDTNYLVASINAPGGVSAPSPAASQTRPPSIISREAGGLFGSFMSLFSYAGASQSEVIVSDAHAAATAMSGNVPQLEAWKNGVEINSLSFPVDLGVFSNSDIAAETARQFALLGAVERKAETVDGQIVTQLTITSVKPGVAASDLMQLAQELGLNLG